MKARESGMPEEKMWTNFFNTDFIFEKLEIDNTITHLTEFGFGYGTFTIPAAKIIVGSITAFDIEEELSIALLEKMKKEGISNVSVVKKDFIAEGTGLDDEVSDYIMLFNILHAEKSAEILNECYRILKKGGKLGVIHWNYDPTTPRGPSMSIRPKPEGLKNMLINAGFIIKNYNINLHPYHYGIIGIK